MGHHQFILTDLWVLQSLLFVLQSTSNDSGAVKFTLAIEIRWQYTACSPKFGRETCALFLLFSVFPTSKFIFFINAFCRVAIFLYFQQATMIEPSLINYSIIDQPALLCHIIQYQQYNVRNRNVLNSFCFSSSSFFFLTQNTLDNFLYVYKILINHDWKIFVQGHFKKTKKKKKEHQRPVVPKLFQLLPPCFQINILSASKQPLCTGGSDTQGIFFSFIVLYEILQRLSGRREWYCPYQSYLKRHPPV